MKRLQRLRINCGRAGRGSRLSAAAFGLLLSFRLGCASVSMTAVDARAPIVLGPVGCIGCSADAERPQGGVWQSARARRRFVGALTLIDSGNEKSFFFDADLTAAPCAEDFRISRLHASAWSVTVPILFRFEDLTIDAEVQRTAVPNGSCLPGASP